MRAGYFFVSASFSDVLNHTIFIACFQNTIFFSCIQTEVRHESKHEKSAIYFYSSQGKLNRRLAQFILSR
jgi:3-phenylpropionate/cinnamic acid dioxygenase small subunit